MELQFDNIRRYCIDMSALIVLDNSYRKPFETFRAVWKELDDLIEQGNLHTSDFVEIEADSYTGTHTFIQEWLKERRDKLIIPTSTEILIAAAQVINENQNTGFLNPQKWAEGKNEADPYLIAIGMLSGHVIITHENFDKPNRIPKVAGKYGVQAISVLDFFPSGV